MQPLRKQCLKLLSELVQCKRELAWTTDVDAMTQLPKATLIEVGVWVSRSVGQPVGGFVGRIVETN